MSGKGSAPRPFSVSDDIYSANWALVFGDARGQAEPEVEQEAEQPSQPAAD